MAMVNYNIAPSSPGEALSRLAMTVANGTTVWTGRALQVEYDDLEIIGLAHLYSAL
jgi:hypothetical protein